MKSFWLPLPASVLPNWDVFPAVQLTNSRLFNNAAVTMRNHRALPSLLFPHFYMISTCLQSISSASSTVIPNAAL